MGNFVYMRELMVNDSIAVVMRSTAVKGFGGFIKFDASMVPGFVSGWNNFTVFTARNLLNHSVLGQFEGSLKDLIRPQGVGMYKLTPVQKDGVNQVEDRVKEDTGM